MIKVEHRLKPQSISVFSRCVVSAANNARIHIILGGSDVEGPGAGVGDGGGGRGPLPETQTEGVETECAGTEVVAGLPGGALPIEPQPVFCELCELRRADSQPDGLAAADEALTWKEIARCTITGNGAWEQLLFPAPLNIFFTNPLIT